MTLARCGTPMPRPTSLIRPSENSTLADSSTDSPSNTRTLTIAVSDGAASDSLPAFSDEPVVAPGADSGPGSSRTAMTSTTTSPTMDSAATNPDFMFWLPGETN